MQCPQISDEKKSFASLTNNFWSFKNGLKKYSSMEQNLFFFHQKSEGIAFTFCRYLYQNMRAFIFCRYCPPIVFCPQIWKTKKSSKVEGNTLGILRRSFFPRYALGMPSFNNSVEHWLSVHRQQRSSVIDQKLEWWFDPTTPKRFFLPKFGATLSVHLCSICIYSLLCLHLLIC